MERTNTSSSFGLNILHRICRYFSDAAMSKERSRLEPLKCAVEAGDEAQVREVLQRTFARRRSRRSPLNCQTGGEILWDAVLNDRMEIASMLVEAGTNLKVRRSLDNRRTSFLHRLVKSHDWRHHRLAVQMMEHGADVNANDGYPAVGQAPLNCGIRANSSIDIIRELVKHGARVFDCNIIDAAFHPNAAEVMDLLVRGFVDAETRRKRVDEALLYCSRVPDDMADLDKDIMPAVKLLLDMKLAVEELKMSRYILLNAIQSNNVNLVESLIEYGFDVNQPALGCKPPLYAASKLKQSVITEILIRAGAKVNACTGSIEGYKGYAIHAACKRERTENVQVLLRLGADVNLTDSENRTPFSLIGFTGQMSPAHRMFIKHLGLLTLKGKIVNNSDLNIIESHSEMRAYYDKCLNELESMKSMKIMGNVSFFSFFKNVWEISFLSRNSGFLEYYDRVQRKDKFPIYHEEMAFALESAKTRKNLLTEKEEAIRESLENILTFVPLERIIYYFYLNEVD